MDAGTAERFILSHGGKELTNGFILRVLTLVGEVLALHRPEQFRLHQVRFKPTESPSFLLEGSFAEVFILSVTGFNYALGCRQFIVKSDQVFCQVLPVYLGSNRHAASKYPLGLHKLLFGRRFQIHVSLLHL